jgi:amidase
VVDTLPRMTDELWRMSAVEAVGRLRAGEVSPLELVDAALERIEQVDGMLNALPTVAAERAREAARHVDPGSPLAGLPIAVKDLNDVAGVRTTYGSPIYADHVPDASESMVARLEQRGAVVLAKSNTPEFGAGGNTFNEVFGETRNPWDTRLTCGGSSGGSAAALAAGEVWLATGSDLGGSLRTPAGFCGVVGIRPTPGRVPNGPDPLPFDTLGVEGPMGRSVADAALMLDAMAGHEASEPLSLAAPARPFLEAAAQPRRLQPGPWHHSRRPGRARGMRAGRRAARGSRSLRGAGRPGHRGCTGGVPGAARPRLRRGDGGALRHRA